MQQYSELSYLHHCDGSNVSDISKQKSELAMLHTSKKNNNNYYNMVKQIVTCLKVTLIVPELLLIVAISS